LTAWPFWKGPTAASTPFSSEVLTPPSFWVPGRLSTLRPFDLRTEIELRFGGNGTDHFHRLLHFPPGSRDPTGWSLVRRATSEQRPEGCLQGELPRGATPYAVTVLPPRPLAGHDAFSDYFWVGRRHGVSIEALAFCCRFLRIVSRHPPFRVRLSTAVYGLLQIRPPCSRLSTRDGVALCSRLGLVMGELPTRRRRTSAETCHLSCPLAAPDSLFLTNFSRDYASAEARLGVLIRCGFAAARSVRVAKTPRRFFFRLRWPPGFLDWLPPDFSSDRRGS